MVAVAEAPPADYRIRRRRDETSSPACLVAPAPASAPVFDMVFSSAQSSSAQVTGSEAEYIGGLTYVPAYNSGFIRLMNQLSRFRHLKEGWDGYGAKPPNEKAVYWAQKVAVHLMRANLIPERVEPSVENGVSISFRHGDKYADIECFNSGEILAVTSDGSGDPHVWHVFPESADIDRTVERIDVFLGS